jgi:type II secretory pathway pseudopilin PulG
MLKSHEHVLQYVDDYLHEVLASADSAYVDDHCQRCQICKAALDQARERYALLEMVPGKEASAQLIEATLKRIETYERRRSQAKRILMWTALSATSATVFLTVGLWLYYRQLALTPYDVKVLGQTALLAGSNASLRIQVLDHPRAAALEGIPVDIELRDPASSGVITLAHFTTDADGTGKPSFRLPDWPAGRYELRVVAYPAGGPESLAHTVQLRRSFKLMLSTDKPVYQPGQTILVRSLALRRPDLRPAAGRTAVFSVTDPKGNVILKRTTRTSDFGITAIDCPLAAEILEGTYAIACKIEDTESKTTVAVKKYVLPKFKVVVDVDQPYYQPGQTIHGKVRANYFFGKAVADAQVTIDAKVNEPPLVEFHREIGLRTDSKGDASFELAIPALRMGSEPEPVEWEVTAQITVTDAAGQKQTENARWIVTTSPLRVDLVAEAGSLVRGVANRVFVFAHYADGRAAKARITINGAAREVITDDLGFGWFEITPDSDDATWLVEAADGNGRVFRREIRLTCGQASQDFLIRTDKAVYRAGETVHLTAIGGGDDPVFVDIVKDNQTIVTEKISMTGGRGERKIDLPVELFGTVQLCNYRFSADGIPVRKSRVLYIDRAREIRVRADLDRPVYRPGQRARLGIALTDERGEPAPGAVSLAAVDEAVFSVLARAPGTEQRYSETEPDLLRPIYEVYRWSPRMPVAKSPVERARFEQALFARTARDESHVDRKTLVRELMPFLENDESLLGVLERPDWENLVSPDWFSKEALSILRTASTPQTLSADTFAPKVKEVEARKRKIVTTVCNLWIILAVLLAFVGVMAAVVHFPRPHITLVELLVILAIFLVLVGLVLPANQKVREASNRMKAMNDLRQISLAFEAFQDTHGRLPGQTENDQFAVPVRCREWFPETLLWRPELITDDQGHVNLDVDLADSITTWRLTASAVTADGRLGGGSAAIRVFQPFFIDLNLPATLTCGDEIAIPAVVYNYTDKPQAVELSLAEAPWFKRLDDAVKKLEVTPRGVHSVSFRLRMLNVGKYRLRVNARGSGVADSIQREVEIVPNGRRVEKVVNGNLQHAADLTLATPADAIEGSPAAILSLYPSSFSQLVEGLDGIFRMPYGCFEQTSSTTYPNVLALDYLRRTSTSAPEVEAKARRYIHLGYQRLLGFEVEGGGFDWFGRPAANRLLTAYGLMEFQDMARVHDVDPHLIERTRAWLLAQRNNDGSWSSEKRFLHDSPAGARSKPGLADLRATAYIAWAVFSELTPDRVGPTLSYLLSQEPESLQDDYTLALVCNALLAMRATESDLAPYLARLESLQQTSKDGSRGWWSLGGGEYTAFYGSGRCGAVETTALAALALVQANRNPPVVRRALAWLIQEKGPAGTWHSTQATVLALKAILAAAKSLHAADRKEVDIRCDGRLVQRVEITGDDAEAMQRVDLSRCVATGTHHLAVTQQGGVPTVYQLTFHYHVPGTAKAENAAPLAITMTYDRHELLTGETVLATATVTNQGQHAAHMVLVDLPVPPGFVVETEDFDRLVSSDVIAKCEVSAAHSRLYLRSLESKKPLKLSYRLRAVIPGRITVAAATVYEYYVPEKQAHSLTDQITVMQTVTEEATGAIKRLDQHRQ